MKIPDGRETERRKSRKRPICGLADAWLCVAGVVSTDQAGSEKNRDVPKKRLPRGAIESAVESCNGRNGHVT